MNNLFDKACLYAIEKHKGQRRKDGSIYILHPFEVATIVSSITNDEEILAASMLHDVCEDCGVDVFEIKEFFTERVYNIVSLETEPKYNDISKHDSWRLRKETALNRLEETNEIGFKIIYLSDKLANIRSLYRDYTSIGVKAFDKFNNSSIEEQKWYYYSVLDKLSELSNTDAYNEFKSKLDIIFK